MSWRWSALWSVIALTSVLSLPAVATPDGKPPGRPEAPGSPAQRLHRHLEGLDREVGRHWRRVQRKADRGDLPAEASARRRITGDTEGFRRRLDLLNVKVQELSEEERRALRSKVRSIGRVLGNLERVAAGQNPPRSGKAAGGSSDSPSQTVGVRSLAAASTAANTCSDAPLITAGTFTGTTLGATNDGTASCGSSDFSPDVWFRWVAPSSGAISMDTFGSGFDTVLSVRTACPPTGFETRCNDDAFGLQSAVSFFASAGATYWIRISGFNGASGSFEFHLGSGGAISGTVTRTSDGTAVDTGTVEARSSTFFLSQGDLQADGTYTLPTSRAAADVKVRTATEGALLDEAWDDHPCAGPLFCDFSVGDDVIVNSVETTPGIDFALDVGGAIAGQVVHGVTGDPVAGAEIEAWSSSGATRLATSVTGADGAYRVEGLATGTYRVLARSSSFADQLYDGNPCPSPCDTSEGTPVGVTLGTTTSGIDFSLQRLGIFEGTVTEATTGDPVEGAFVRVSSASGSFAGSGLTDAGGSYQIGGVAPGTYFLTATASGLVTELYQEILCPFPCDEIFGTPVEVMIDQVVSGIDFTLEGPGSISGAFTASGTDEPIVASADVFDADGRFVEESLPFVESYSVDGLPAGQYFVRAQGVSGFLDELYDDIPCFPGCSLQTGTPVTVLAETETSGIDFALDRGGIITGRLTDALTGAPLANGSVTLWAESGSFVTSNNHADENGVYEAVGLVPGSYVAESFAAGYVSQLYDGVPCFGGVFGFGGCRLEDGDLVTVDIDVTVSGIDFAKQPLARLSGRIFHAATGEPLSFADVFVFDSSGVEVERGFANFDGTWSVRVPAGRYFLLSSNFDGAIDEIYDGHECPTGCDPTEGTPVIVEAGEERTGLDFSLERPGTISGSVVSASTGEPLSFVEIEAFGGPHRFFNPSASTDIAGRYEVNGLFTATYFLRAEKSGFLSELYDDFICGGPCDPVKSPATPVQAAAGTDIPDIDFALEPFTSGLVGSVIDATTGLPVVGVGVRIFDSTGALIRRVVTRTGGVWLAGLSPGTYFVTTDTEGAYIDQIHSGVDCTGECDPLSGTAVTVGDASVVRGIEFMLQPGPAIFTDGFESGDLSMWLGIVP